MTKIKILEKCWIVIGLCMSIFFVRCKNTQTNNSFSDNNKLSDIISTYDTLITLDVVLDNYLNNKITTDNAKNTLYQYFRDKQIYTEEDLKFMDIHCTDDIIIVDFNTLYILNINGKELGIITYWLKPPYVSGHCWQLHKCIISSRDNSLFISNEDFIPESFMIDTAKIENNKVVIEGNEYDCGEHTSISSYQAILNILIKGK